MSIVVESNPPLPGKNKYLVWNTTTNVFDEFPVKLGEVQVGNFLGILVAPPIRRAGFLSHKKQIFHLSIHDLLRNHFNVTKPYIINNITATSTGPASTIGIQPASNTNKPRSKTDIGDEFDKESSLYWQEQINSLLNSED